LNVKFIPTEEVSKSIHEIEIKNCPPPEYVLCLTKEEGKQSICDNCDEKILNLRYKNAT